MGIPPYTVHLNTDTEPICGDSEEFHHLEYTVLQSIKINTYFEGTCFNLEDGGNMFL